MAIEKRWEDCYNRSWRSKCYCVGGCFSCIGAWVTANRPCPALLFASLLLSYHVFLALTSLLFFGKNYFCRKAEPLSHASRSPFRGAFFDAASQKPPLKGEGDRLRRRGSRMRGVPDDRESARLRPMAVQDQPDAFKSPEENVFKGLTTD